MKTTLTFVAATILLAPAAFAEDKPAADKFYAAKCASCHGKDGKGVEKMAKMLKTEAKELDLVDAATLSKKDEELIAVTLDGKKKMPAYKAKLGGLDVAELIRYVRSLKPVEAPKGK